MNMLRHWLAKPEDQGRQDWVKRFAPRFWTVAFPRPMMAAVTTTAPRSLRADLVFQRRCDLAGLVWGSADRWSHPLLSYATRRDYRGCVLSFDWVASPGLMPLDAVHGPTLTVEGRDAEGAARTWYVRLWNYANGTPGAARVRLDFDDLAGGFLHPSEADPVWAGDIDRLSISLVAAGYDGSEGPLSEPVEAWSELHDLRCEGQGSVLPIGDAFIPEHSLRMCGGYDDMCNQVPERLVEQWFALGYREIVNHYVGMSHYPALRRQGGRWMVDAGKELCLPAAAWHAALAAACREHGYRLILSLSFELLSSYAPEDWVQRRGDGGIGLTGWEPPSALLSPCNAEAVAWLGRVAAALVGGARAAGADVDFQVGEPWWWVGSDHTPCFYDQATSAAWIAEHDSPLPLLTDVRQAGQQHAAFLDWLGEQLAGATFAVRDAAKAAGAERALLLFYAPQVLARDSPMLARANMPARWAAPAWDVLQLEDYSFVVDGDAGGMTRAREAVDHRLGYAVGDQDYLAGFALTSGEASTWQRIGDAAGAAMDRGVRHVFVWAWPQVARDGWTAFQEGEAEVDAFDDVEFPLACGFEAGGGPEFSTLIAALASGHEQRNANWAAARLRYDAGIGVRSDSDLAALVAFFRARRGPLKAFRFRDPLDHASGADGCSPVPVELGVGDGRSTAFPLVKSYGDDDEAPRRITRPVPASIVVSVAGSPRTDWTLERGGVIVFDDPPEPGACVAAGFVFDVPVRFEEDRLHVSLGAWRAGMAPSIPLVEVRES